MRERKPVPPSRARGMRERKPVPPSRARDMRERSTPLSESSCKSPKRRARDMRERSTPLSESSCKSPKRRARDMRERSTSPTKSSAGHARAQHPQGAPTCSTGRTPNQHLVSRQLKAEDGDPRCAGPRPIQQGRPATGCGVRACPALDPPPRGWGPALRGASADPARAPRYGVRSPRMPRARPTTPRMGTRETSPISPDARSERSAAPAPARATPWCARFQRARSAADRRT